MDHQSESSDLAATTDPARTSLAAAVRGSLRVVLVAQLISQAISLAVLAALYRLVNPGDFGLLGMIVPWLLLLRNLSTAGLSVAAVQQPGLSSRQVGSLFWLQLALGSAATLFTAATAWVLARFYGIEQLFGLGAALAGTSLVAALGATHQALLERRMAFSRLMGARLAAQLAGGSVGVALALREGGVWALVGQQYAELAALTALAWVLERWRPGLPQLGRDTWSLVRFGGYYSGSSLVFFVAQNADKVLLAWLLGGTAAGRIALGSYTQMFQLAMKPVYLATSPLTSVMLSALSRRRSAPAAYARAVGAFYRATALILLPCGAGLCLVAPEVVRVLAGAAWQEAGPILAALAPVIMAQGLLNIAGTVFASAGRADRLFVGSLATLLALLAAYLVGYATGRLANDPILGATRGVALGYTLGTALLLVPYTWFCLATVGVPWRAVAAAVRRPLLATGGMALAVWAAAELLGWFPQTGAFVRLALLAAVGAAVYGLLARGEIRWGWQQVIGGRREA